MSHIGHCPDYHQICVFTFAQRYIIDPIHTQPDSSCEKKTEPREISNSPQNTQTTKCRDRTQIQSFQFHLPSALPICLPPFSYGWPQQALNPCRWRTELYISNSPSSSSCCLPRAIVPFALSPSLCSLQLPRRNPRDLPECLGRVRID